MLSGCISMLPQKQDVMESPWKDFSEAKAAYDKITPNESTTAELQELGVDPYKTPNVRILSYLDLIGRFLPNNSVKVENLDAHMQACFAVLDDCTGYEFSPKHIEHKRTGWVLPDVFNFSRTTVKTGWSFSALIVLNRDRVVYKIWNGVPVMREERTEDNPLGPLQDSGGILRSQIPLPTF